jgi:hypothetical protein
MSSTIEKEEPYVEMGSDENTDSSDDEEVDEKITEKLLEIDDKIRQNPFDYQAHVDKIGVLKTAGELDNLRQAREKFAELYPLSAALWLDW